MADTAHQRVYATYECRREVSTRPLPLELSLWLLLVFVFAAAFAVGTYAHAAALQTTYAFTVDVATGTCAGLTPAEHAGTTLSWRVLWLLAAAVLLCAHGVWAWRLWWRHSQWWTAAVFDTNTSAHRQPLASAYRLYVLYSALHMLWFTCTLAVCLAVPSVRDHRYGDFLALHVQTFAGGMPLFAITVGYAVYNQWHTWHAERRHARRT